MECLYSWFRGGETIGNSEKIRFICALSRFGDAKMIHPGEHLAIRFKASAQGRVFRGFLNFEHKQRGFVFLGREPEGWVRLILDAPSPFEMSVLKFPTNLMLN